MSGGNHIVYVWVVLPALLVTPLVGGEARRAAGGYNNGPRVVSGYRLLGFVTGYLSLIGQPSTCSNPYYELL